MKSKTFNKLMNNMKTLEHYVDLIFLRRIGGGYIFIHRLLMEHFAEMYVNPSTSKENLKCFIQTLVTTAQTLPFFRGKLEGSL